MLILTRQTDEREQERAFLAERSQANAEQNLSLILEMVFNFCGTTIEMGNSAAEKLKLHGLSARSPSR